MAYDKNTDYQAKINDAVAKGDYGAAKKYEQQRNEKIASGSGGDNQKTYDYQEVGWDGAAGGTGNVGGYKGAGTSGGGSSSGSTGDYDKNTDYSVELRRLIDSGASKTQVQDVLDKRIEKAAREPGLSQYLTDDVYYEAMKYLGTEKERDSYSPTYEGKIDGILEGILTLPQFRYDPEQDPVYAKYKESYRLESDRAIENILAQSASLTGGTASSYAMTAATQAADYYNKKLADQVPALYDLAFEVYREDIENRMYTAEAYGKAEDRKYDRYRDDVKDDASREAADYTAYRDRTSDSLTKEKQKQEKEEFRYGLWRDRVLDQRWLKQFDYETAEAIIENARKEREITLEESQLALAKWKAENQKK